MKKHQLISIVMLMTIISVLLASCGPAKGKKEAVNLNDYTLEEIIKKAQEEGHVESVGMPDSWANWGDTWEGLTKKYGITHADTDMSSAEELNMFENEKDSPPKTLAISDSGLPQKPLKEASFRVTRPATGKRFPIGQKPKMANG